MRRSRQAWRAVGTAAIGLVCCLAAGCGSASSSSSTGETPASVTTSTDPPPSARPAVKTRCTPVAPELLAATSWPPARRELAPPGVISIRLCRYSGLNGHPPRDLVFSRLIANRSRIGDTRIGELIRELDRLPSQHGVFACPNDTGAEIVALLAYPESRVVTISVGLDGCQSVTNGALRRSAAGSPSGAGQQLIAELERLTTG